MGRPKTNRNVRLELRLSEDESKLLEECVKLLSEPSGFKKTTRTDAIIKGITILHETLTSQE